MEKNYNAIKICAGKPQRRDNHGSRHIWKITVKYISEKYVRI
jgi:hypothetical protein